MRRIDGLTHTGTIARRLAVTLAAALAWFGTVPAIAQDLQVIELRYRLADDLIPVLEPLLEPGGVLTGMDGTLFVRTSPGNLAQIRQAVAELDRKPRQLLLTVSQGTVATDARTSVTGSATVGGGDVRVGVNGPPAGEAGAEFAVRDMRQKADLQSLGSVRTLEGSETYVSIGQSLPVTTTQVMPGARGPVVSRTADYRNVSSGFYATPRVAGDRVTLEISPRQQRLEDAPRGAVIQTAGASSVVSGRLGEWIALGAVESSDSGGSAGLLVWGRYSSASRYTAWIKVDEIP